MSIGQKVADAAEALVGTPFRLQGRTPATGLDCIGLVHCALSQAGLSPVAPDGYRLRNVEIAGFLAFAERSGLVSASGPPMPGDVLLTRPGAAQHHLYVALDGGRFVHAHAGIRRVVLHAAPLAQPILRHWRPQNQE